VRSEKRRMLLRFLTASSMSFREWEKHVEQEFSVPFAFVGGGSYRQRSQVIN
jgi:hypothetical protein